MPASEDSPSGDLGLAVALTALAGAVDAIGFLKLGGFFVSFMSGNSTKAAVAWVLRAPAELGLALTLIGLFVAGACAGAVVAWASGARRRAVVLALVGLLLAGALAAGRASQVGFAAALMAFALGLQNAALHRVGGIVVGPTYVTGTLARLGDGIGRALVGEAGVGAWAPYLLQWLGLILGGGVGALVYARYDLDALVVPALFAALLSAFEFARRPREEPTP